LLSNKEDHAVEAQDELKKYGDVSKVEWKKCDLSDLKQTDQVAKELSKLTQIDALILNAGLGVGNYSMTVDGIGISSDLLYLLESPLTCLKESHIQVNLISQAHLAQVLLPVLLKTRNSRLIMQSSDMHRFAHNDSQFLTLSELNQDIGPTKLYNRSKLAQALYIRKLARLAADNKLGFTAQGLADGPWCIATHPGGVKTDQQEQAVEAYGLLGKIGVALVRPFLKDPTEQGCRPALFAATSGDVVSEKLQGVYIVPDRKVTDPSSEARDEKLQDNLWNLTQDILEEKLGQSLKHVN